MKDIVEAKEETPAPEEWDSGKFKVTKWTKLDRFLILGSDASKYNVSNRPNFSDLDTLTDCVAEDGVRVVDTAVEVSQKGRAFRNDAAIMAIAFCMKMGDLTTRRAAGAAMHKVVRTGTHLFQLANFIDQLGGWGRITKRSLQNWYMKKDPGNLGYQLMKYQSREGWSHGDVLRKVRPKPDTEVRSDLFQWAVQSNKFEDRPEDEALARIWGMQQCSDVPVDNADKAISLIHEFDLPRECIPTWHRNNPRVQLALLNKMPIHALVRNLGSMTASGLFDQFPDAVKMVTEKLKNEELLKKARVHPMAILQALAVYRQGGGVRGKLTWKPMQRISAALNDAFYMSFQTVEPTNKRICLALDVSGSMGTPVNGLNMTCRDAAAAMALVTRATELRTEVIGFTCAGTETRQGWSSGGAGSKPMWEDKRYGVGGLDIAPTRRLDEVIGYVAKLPFGGTDCAAPILWAMDAGKLFDLFVVYTDSETWAGKIKPYEALQEYRRKTAIPARLVVVGMSTNDFSIANPEDPGMLDVVGCDTSTPKLISEFANGNI